MTDALRENRQLRRILEISRHMAVTNDLDVLLGTIVEAACEVLDCERATIFLYDAQTRELFSRVASGVDGIRFPVELGIAGVAARQRICVNVPDAYADPRFNPDVDRRTGFRTRNLLAFPLENLQGDLMGVLQALNKRGGAFDAGDEELARVLSAQAGVALERARLIREFAEKQRMQRDLEIARSIQQAYLPKRDPCVPGYEITGWNRSAEETGGDCYDFLPLADGRLAVLLADASGHGIGAALVIAQARSLLRAILHFTDDLPRIAGAINGLLAQDLGDERFVTAFIGILDPRRHTLEYVSGGQGPLLLFSAGGVESRPATGIPFAAIAEFAYGGAARFDFPPGGLLALLTDGFYETESPRGEQFGEARVVEIVQRSLTAPVGQIIARLLEAVQSFADGQVQADDLTAVLVRRTADGE
jgi:phosphoserine phosphatase